jgi:hypothetical protein
MTSITLKQTDPQPSKDYAFLPLSVWVSLLSNLIPIANRIEAGLLISSACRFGQTNRTSPCKAKSYVLEPDGPRSRSDFEAFLYYQ